ncbi:DUF2189 domain-containing protein [Ideonella sp. DXS29W]|uniref:DUF2189 domain-containing protein n=1 Tax=Ideonella lacteola TaxID=2984193 RepID=A0ABU9BUS9_9BURK
MPNRLTERALQQSRSFGVRRIPALRPLGWLARGWQDLIARPLPGLLHGVALAGFGALLIWYARHQFWWLAGAISGFLLVAPALATGLYAISRALERGEPAGLSTALRAWIPQDHRMVVFGLLLALAGTGWMLTSASLITSALPGQVNRPVDFIRLVVLPDHGVLFETWLALGALMAAPVFASSVVAMPMLLDQRISVLGAVFTSWRAVMEHPAPMALWALLILSLTTLGMATMMLGLVVVLPWLAHASWHAYRDLVRPIGEH